jgi:O-methyltransferase
MLLSISIVQLISVVLILVFLFLAFKVMETSWSYKISKPHKWEEAVKVGLISKELIKIERTYRDKVRFYNLWFQVDRLKRMKVQGAFAELGVYKGETALMLHHMDMNRCLHLFDTFEGFNSKDLNFEKSNDERYTTENFSDTTLESVKELFKDAKGISFYPGYFPVTTKTLAEKTFALVHIDADLYLPTIEALRYFYPKVSPGGVLIIHDYNHTWDGIKKAVDEFLDTIPESLTEVLDWQGSVMIIKNSK